MKETQITIIVGIRKYTVLPHKAPGFNPKPFCKT